MILSLFVVLMSLSLIIIALGLFRTEHSELALIGFVLMFLLSLVILNDSLYYKNGEIVNSTFEYSEMGNLTLLSSSDEIYTNTYDVMNFDGGATSHLVGYWLAVMSIIGFIAVILGLRKSRGYK